MLTGRNQYIIQYIVHLYKMDIEDTILLNRKKIRDTRNLCIPLNVHKSSYLLPNNMFLLLMTKVKIIAHKKIK